MAKFVKKGSPGGVGTLTTHAESPTESGLDKGLLKQEIPESIEELTSGIKTNHLAFRKSLGEAIFSAGRAGQLILSAKGKLAGMTPKKNFTEWLAETFTFSQRMAYYYIDVYEKIKSRADEVEKCESIRDVLRLIDKDDDSKKKKKRDPKKESFVLHAAKIEQWYANETAISPVEDWDPERLKICSSMLGGVVRIYNELIGVMK